MLLPGATKQNSVSKRYFYTYIHLYKLQRHFTNILSVRRRDTRIFRRQSCCSDRVFYSVKSMSVCFATRVAQEQSSKWLEKELQGAGFADFVSLFYQTTNSEILRYWIDILEQFEHCRTLLEQILYTILYASTLTLVTLPRAHVHS